MGIREKMNQSPLYAVSAAVVALLVIAGMIAYQFLGDSGTGQAKQAFFTIDDGKSWFPDENSKLSPFTKDGKPAYRVYVWTSNGGKTKFVSHMERYTEEARGKLERALADKQQIDPGLRQLLATTGIEVKGPGDAEWVSLGTPKGAKIASPRGPDGKLENVEPVVP